MAKEIFEGTVRDMSVKGLGVVDHPNGRVFFVPGTVIGDEGTFVIEKLEKRYGFASVHTLVKTSALRVTPSCIHHGFGESNCHGCPWMMVDYKEQLKLKEKFVHYALSKSHLISEKTEARPIIGSPRTLGYRNRAQLKTNGVELGFVSPHTNQIVPIQDCPVLDEIPRVHLKTLLNQLPNPAWEPGPRHDWNFIDIDDEVDAIDAVQLNRRRPFKQGNTGQNDAMRRWLRDEIKDFPSQHSFVELFCGSGNFTTVLAEKGFAQIIAAEASGPAIDQLAATNLPNVLAVKLDLYKPSGLNRLKKLVDKPRYLLLDPPRTGFKQIADYAKQFKSLEKLIYISCDIPTFSYDGHLLSKLGWRLKCFQPLDLFPQTPHVELLAVYERT